MVVTVHIADSIRHVVEGLPQKVVIKARGAATVRQLALDIGVPPILVVFAVVDGVKIGLDEIIGEDADVHLVGTMSGG